MLRILLVVFFFCAWIAAEEDSIHRPILDLDGDLFSSEPGYRGCLWRGKDGFDLDKAIHSGVIKDNDDGLFDYDCNGISGWSMGKDKSYEELYAGKSTNARGVVIFGDSAAAAFHIPEEWVKKAGLNGIKNLLDPAWILQTALDGAKEGSTESILLNEFDWPHKSWATGFAPEIQGESIYMRMRERNLAIHRDFQNLAVNGAKARSLVEQVGDFSRHKSDKPVLAFVAYIGNDICKKKLEDMTNPEEYRQQILDGLEALNNKIPAGSKVVLIGLVDGRILWNTMHDKPHPLGLTYGELYEFLHEVQGNPCRTWLTADENSRTRASERAVELSAILKEIATTKQYGSFEMIYLDMPMQKVIALHTKQGGNVADLIEVVDGFHPSHTCHRLLSKVIWEELETNHPSFLCPVNPSNDKIRKMFGEQGGH